MKITDIKKVHMVGIGGIGMSGLARLLLYEKKEVSGSDREKSDITAALQQEGVTVVDAQEATNVTDDMDLVVYTEAMDQDHPELARARELKIPTVNYFEALGMVANEYYLIAIAGTHGKTTTTAMTIDVLEAAGLDPTAIVGSLRNSTGSNFRAGKSKYFVVEACEYRRDFLHLTPDILAITNIESDHLDYFSSTADIEQAFGELIAQVREDGVVVCNPSDEHVANALQYATVRMHDYTKHLDPLLKLRVPGTHNHMNAAAASAIGALLEIERETVAAALKDFVGTWRRFAYKGTTASGALVYDDYAHHPTEIRATITSARELYPDKRIIGVFQPHLHSRTRELFDDFVEALALADEIIVTDIYDARNTYAVSVSSDMLATALQNKNANAAYIPDFNTVPGSLKDKTSESDVILVMGAGDITQLSTTLTLS